MISSILNTLVYVTGGVKYSVPNDLLLTYGLTQLRFLFVSYLICFMLSMPYTVSIMAITVLLADFRFFQDFTNAVEDEIDEDFDS